MNLSSPSPSAAAAAAPSLEHPDSRYFSQRAKHISLLNGKLSPRITKPISLAETCFQFSNRTYVPIPDTQSARVGRGHSGPIVNDHVQNLGTGRGRTTVPLSSFVLQKDNVQSTSTVTTVTAPIFVMHDEVQFVRPYFGPPNHKDTEDLSSTSHKREVLLSALKEIESSLKTL